MKSLINCPGTANYSLLIWDNSPAEFCEKNAKEAVELESRFISVEYRSTPENTSLSVLYNSVMEVFFAGKSAGQVTFLDQDSNVAENFLIELDKLCDASRLVVPKVISNKSGVVISPRRQKSYYLFDSYKFRADFHASDVGRHPSANLFAVGSGLTLPFQLWREGLRFDENISFYGVDTELCRDYQNFRDEFVLADTILLHDVSSENVEEKEVTGWRFDRYMEYWRYQLAKHCPYPKTLTSGYVRLFRALYRLKQAVRSKYG